MRLSCSAIRNFWIDRLTTCRDVAVVVVVAAVVVVVAVVVVIDLEQYGFGFCSVLCFDEPRFKPHLCLFFFEN